jgi:hypothetical protein
MMTIVLKRAPVPSPDHMSTLMLQVRAADVAKDFRRSTSTNPRIAFFIKSPKNPLPGACIPVTRSLQKKIRSHSGRV